MEYNRHKIKIFLKKASSLVFLLSLLVRISIGQIVTVSVKNNCYTHATLLGFNWEGSTILSSSEGNNGEFKLLLKSVLNTGVYKVAFDSIHHFEFIADGLREDYRISVEAGNLRLSMKVEQSPDNDYFQKMRKFYYETEKVWEKVKFGSGKERTGKSWTDRYYNLPTHTDRETQQLFGYSYSQVHFVPGAVDYLEEKDNSAGSYIYDLPFNDERLLHTEAYCMLLKRHLQLVGRDKDFLVAWLDNVEIAKPIAVKLFDELITIFKTSNDFAALMAFNTFFDRYYLNKECPLYGCSSFSEKEIMEIYDDGKFKTASILNSQKSYQSYLSLPSNQKYKAIAQHKIDSIEFKRLVTNKKTDEIEEFIKNKPTSYSSELKTVLDSVKFNEALGSHTIAAYTAFIASYPKSKFKNSALQQIEIIKNEEKAKAILAEIEKKERIEAEKRKAELNTACEEGTESIIKFANKYQNTAEATQAIRILGRYNADKEVISNKIAVLEKFIWINQGDRRWIEEVLERQRKDFSGGKQFNTFGFATLQNKTEKEINIVATVKLQLIKMTNLSLLISSSTATLTENFYMKLAPNQKKSLVVVFKNIGEGITMGRNRNDHSLGGVIFSAGSTTEIDYINPITINISETSPIAQSVIDSQDQLVQTIVDHKGNIAINNVSQRDAMNKWFDNLTGTSSQDEAVLRIYFTKKGSSRSLIQIFDNRKVKISDREVSSSGDHTESFTLKADRNYFVSIPGCSQFVPVYVRKRTTQLIVDANCNANVNMEDAK